MIRDVEIRTVTVVDVCWCYADRRLGRLVVSFMGTRISLYWGERMI